MVDPKAKESVRSRVHFQPKNRFISCSKRVTRFNSCEMWKSSRRRSRNTARNSASLFIKLRFKQIIFTLAWPYQAVIFTGAGFEPLLRSSRSKSKNSNGHYLPSLASQLGVGILNAFADTSNAIGSKVRFCSTATAELTNTENHFSGVLKHRGLLEPSTEISEFSFSNSPSYLVFQAFLIWDADLESSSPMRSHDIRPTDFDRCRELLDERMCADG